MNHPPPGYTSVIINGDLIGDDLEDYLIESGITNDAIIQFVSSDMNRINQGGVYCNRLNDNIILKNKADRTFPVPMYNRDPTDGKIIPDSHTIFYVEINGQSGGGNKNAITDKKTNTELKEIIQYQQHINKNLVERMKELELQKASLIDQKNVLEELLQQNRCKLKDISLDNRNKSEKLIQYEEIIHKLLNSR
tara:strand:+ start:518 stop:1096 length:579 start_codon:yes stop_codon:yes gene_type:complete